MQALTKSQIASVLTKRAPQTKKKTRTEYFLSLLRKVGAHFKVPSSGTVLVHHATHDGESFYYWPKSRMELTRFSG